jgi:hypothetical protein
MRLPVQASEDRRVANASYLAGEAARPQAGRGVNVTPAQMAALFGALGRFRQTKTCCGKITGPLGRPVPYCRTYEVPAFGYTCNCIPGSFGPPVCRPWVFEMA